MTGSIRTIAALSIAGLVMTITSCNVKVDKKENGEDKKVNITTPFGSLDVRNDNVTAKDAGFSVYPGAKERARTENKDNKANVSIDTPMFGLKVVALTFTTPDDPQKVLGFYRDQVKNYGNFVECKGPAKGKSGHGKDDLDKPVSCDGAVEVNDNETSYDDVNSVTLKSGTNGNQHVVAVKPKDGGSEFSLVYVRVHGGKQDSI